MENLPVLLEACKDKYRLVRIRAAASLAVYPEEMISDYWKPVVAQASQELETSLSIRTDQWGYHYNRGNYLMDKQNYSDALNAFETAHELRNDTILPLVNGSIAAARLNRLEKALTLLEKAREIAPKNPGIQLNLGMLYHELGQPSHAKTAFSLALEVNPKSGQAAYNLALLTIDEDIVEGLRLLRIAATVEVPNPKHRYKLAFYLAQNEQGAEAIEILESLRLQSDLPSEFQRKVRQLLNQLKPKE